MAERGEGNSGRPRGSPTHGATTPPLARRRVGGPRHGLLALVVFLTCLPALGYVPVGGPLHEDQDTPFIVRGIDEAGGLAGAWRWFFRDWPLQSRLYRPVTVISIAVDRALWGDWAPGYRLTAWVLALLVSGLAAWLALALTGSEFAAALAAALLAFERLGYNPISVMAVRAYALPLGLGCAVLWTATARLRRAGQEGAARACQALAMAVPVALVGLYSERVSLQTLTTWIAARTAHLGTLFGTLALAFLVLHTRGGQKRWLALALAACGLGLASYEQAVVVPPIATLWLTLTHPGGWRAGLRASAGFWALLAAYVLVRKAVFGLEQSWYHRMQIRVRPKELLEWACYVLPPVEDLAAWRLWPEGWYLLWYPDAWYAALRCAGYLLAAVLLRRHWRAAVLLFGWKAIAFAPMALLPPYSHYFYFSEVGSCILSGLLLAALFGQVGLTSPVKAPGRGLEVGNRAVTLVFLVAGLSLAMPPAARAGPGTTPFRQTRLTSTPGDVEHGAVVLDGGRVAFLRRPARSQTPWSDEAWLLTPGGVSRRLLESGCYRLSPSRGRRLWLACARYAGARPVRAGGESIGFEARAEVWAMPAAGPRMRRVDGPGSMFLDGWSGDGRLYLHEGLLGYDDVRGFHEATGFPPPRAWRIAPWLPGAPLEEVGLGFYQRYADRGRDQEHLQRAGVWAPDGSGCVFARWFSRDGRPRVAFDYARPGYPPRTLLESDELPPTESGPGLPAIEWVGSARVLLQRYVAPARRSYLVLAHPRSGAFRVLAPALPLPLDPLPVVSPDGARVLLRGAEAGGGPGLWLAEVDGTRAEKVATGDARYSPWAWSPDGRWVVVTLEGDLYRIELQE